MDANPLNKNLGAPEAVHRKPRPVKKPEQVAKPADEVDVDLRAALSTKPQARITWLTKACEMARDGRASSRELFDIISNRKFTSGLPFRVGRKMCAIAQDNSMLFSDRQQRHMQSDEWILKAKYGGDQYDERDDEDKGMDDIDVPHRRQEYSNDSRGQEFGPKEYTNDSRGQEFASPEPERFAEAPVSELERREALERRLAAQERERQLKREERKRKATGEEDFMSQFQQPPPKKQQIEEQADMVDNMLERLMGPTMQPEPEQAAEPVVLRRRRRRRHTSRSRSASIQGARQGSSRYRPRAVSRSRSVSVKSFSRSISPADGRRGGRKGGVTAAPTENYEDALRKRMAQRESEIDSSRIPVTWTRDDMRSGRHLKSRSKWGDNKGERIA